MKRIIACFVIANILILTSFNICFSQNSKVKTVVIDAGHGGHDPGCLGSKTKEKDISLAISLKLGAYIEKNCPDVKVIYTRKTDEFVELYRRAQIANENKADLFICIHCNSNPSKESYGSETYVMGLYKTQANLMVAQKENSSILLEDSYANNYDGFNPSSTEAYIVFSLYQNAYMDQSLNFASLVQKQIKNKVGMLDRGVKQAGFLVLWKTAMPSVLIETGFLSNIKDEDFLASESGQDNIAHSIFKAFKEYKNELEGNKFNDKDTVRNTNNEILPYERTVIDTSAKKRNDTIKSVSSKNEIIFKVQFATSSEKKPLNSSDFKGIKDVQQYYQRGLYKYVTGNESSPESALVLLSKVHDMGFRDAFLVAFLNGERISPQEAIKLIKNK
ncbi:MAG: N-acetylmuramoyl-L-alanine amidase [Bacteroidales bacterium]